MSVFLAVGSIILALMALVVFRFVRNLSLFNAPFGVRIALYCVLGAVFVMAAVYMPLRRAGYLSGIFEDIFASSIGVIFALFIFTIIYDIAAIVLVRVLHKPQTLALAQWITAASVVCYIFYGWISALTPPRIERITIDSPRITDELTIAHLTDLHLGNGSLLNTAFARRTAESVSALEPDIVAITGDLIDAKIDKIRDALIAVSEIKTRYGIYFVPGNHEYYYNELDSSLEFLESLGIKVLKNSNTTIVGDFGAIAIVGSLDPAGRRFGRMLPNPSAALNGVDRAQFVLALTHQPKVIADFPPESFDLLLAGHTHGGQIFPFHLAVKIENKFLSGLYDRDERGQVFISSGVGYWGPPMRMFAPNKIALFTLKPTWL
ncbi:putative metallophosphoesterase [Campylobacterota bacterium]|nr:putative metallophosphoesterase [Campylobacterota bacterium]